ncbi:hypothetical protein RYH73_04630 [Olivibacter sp. CPCC 100613]|uniref:hypothetical protein n=1 Tax=Olivibacter sp. CPCC 100613 TaxID=3079931 RepID=UPI002FFCE3B8
MKILFYQSCALFLFFSFLFSSCEKPAPQLPGKPGEETLHTVRFNLKGFSTSITPLANSPSLNVPRLSNPGKSGLMSVIGLEPSPVEQHLYFWSFNEENLLPTKAVNSSAASISFQAADTSPGFTAGYGLSPYPAGRSLSLKGLQSLIIVMPLNGVSQLAKLAFDVGSSGTGPKNFRIYYSIDSGNTYLPLSADNQFTNTKDNARNSYEFDLSEMNTIIQAQQLTIKIEPFEGERGEANDFDQNRGTFKLDNFRLSGIYNEERPGEPIEDISKIHYFVFNADDDLLALQGSTIFNAAEEGADLAFKLPTGNYYALITSNVSHAELLLPSTLTKAADLYISNHFSNLNASIFGTHVPHLEVNSNTQLEVTLKRYFSQVKFEFTDEEDLAHIRKINIRREHNHFVYVPFGSNPLSLDTGATSIEFYPQFNSENKSLSFNQFMGELIDPIELRYVVSVYDTNDTLLRTFTLSSSIKNNVQLLFKGNLLEEEDKQQFQIEWNQAWDDSLTETF